MAFIRKVKTKSGATAVQLARKVGGQIVSLKHLGSAHNQDELTTLMELAKKQLQGNQIALFPEAQPTFTVELKESYSHLLWQELVEQYRSLGFDQLDDNIFRALCLARIVEPTSKLDSLRVLADLGISGIDKNQLYRCLSKVNELDYRKIISQLCFDQAAKRGFSLLLYDVTTLYFEAQAEDDYRKSGLSKERRLEPQIVVGLLVDPSGFPLSVHSFAGNTAETKTILPVVEAFQQEHHLAKVTVVADAGMMSLKNLSALAAAGYTYIVASRLTKIPYAITEYQQTTKTLTDLQIITDKRQDYRIIYQYRAKRAALDLRNINKQIAKARRIISGQSSAHKAKFVTLKTKTKSLNYQLIDKAKTLAGIKGYVTNLDVPDPQIIHSYHQLFQVEASFRMAKSDLRARPIFHRKEEAIEAHLTIILAAIAISRTIESKIGISVKHFVKTLRPIRSGLVLINGQTYLAKEIIPPQIQTILKQLHSGH